MQSTLTDVQHLEIKATGAESYDYSKNMCEREKKFKDFMRWNHNTELFSKLEAVQKMVSFHHRSCIDMLKLGCTTHSHANKCLHKSMTAK